MLRHTILTIALACGASAWALEITSAPGTIAALVGADAETATELTVKGAVDASDLFFIADEMPALTRLDLGDAVIVAYRGKALKSCETYAAATVPALCFAGSRIADVVFPDRKASSSTTALSPPRPSLPSQSAPRKATLGEGAFAACQALVSAAVAPFGEVRRLRLPRLQGSRKRRVARRQCPPEPTTSPAARRSSPSAARSTPHRHTRSLLPELLLTRRLRVQRQALRHRPASIPNTALASARISSPPKASGHGLAGCADLVDVELPASVATLGEGAFLRVPRTHALHRARCMHRSIRISS